MKFPNHLPPSTMIKTRLHASIFLPSIDIPLEQNNMLVIPLSAVRRQDVIVFVLYCIFAGINHGHLCHKNLQSIQQHPKVSEIKDCTPLLKYYKSPPCKC